ncbi:inositol monophosphatase family protein [Planomonospora venezuelensis]|uniref:inositol-phosphate phosphatase n=1 Tax=Planomonospora venezuelensis TaxID=1999 RepID=A0A841CX78_PLAVE|nr:inositol monophosphatase family protein [Planomonospora venezuelensis]MBB5960924.1 myo-inositol-1(or 4)-monophosphatase [Planomonospora venezuelensis]GIN01159.1 inositol monophosphatase [Planomonospora venezuelensis]
MTTDAKSLLPIAQRAVAIAHEIVRTRVPKTISFKGHRDMVTEVDVAVEHAVRDFLSQETPDIGFLGEEEGPVIRDGSGLLWALDPIDGTANFMHGIPLSGISLGLIQDDRSILGVIDLPFLDMLYAASEGNGATCNGDAITTSKADELDAAIVSVGDYAVGADADHKNRVRIPLNHQLASRVQRVRMYGSAAIDLAWVAEGKTDACIMLSNNPWDTAAGVVIAREAGALVTDATGRPHTMRSHATIAAAPAVLAQVIGVLAEAGA